MIRIDDVTRVRSDGDSLVLERFQPVDTTHRLAKADAKRKPGDDWKTIGYYGTLAQLLVGLQRHVALGVAAEPGVLTLAAFVDEMRARCAAIIEASAVPS